MKTNHFNYMDLIKKYMLKIVSFCAFLDIIDKKCVFYMENNQKKLNYSAKKVLTVGDAAFRCCMEDLKQI